MCRVFLAGDAAHVNNPIGGLGLNCGIHDAMELAGTLHQVVTGGADEATLRAFGAIEGVDAVFAVQKTAAFSRRVSSRRAATVAAGTAQ